MADAEARNHWQAWHEQYDDPTSGLARRLEVVRRRLGEAVDALPAGPHRLLSLCAGEGRDVIPTLAARPGLDIRAVLVEKDPTLAGRAEAAAAAAGLADRVEVRVGDAGDPAAAADVVPVDVLLLCGIFGNISPADIRATLAAVPALAVPGGTVLWTRGDRAPDLRPEVRQWAADAGLVEVAWDGAPAPYGVGVARVPDDGRPRGERPLPERLFTFTR